MTNLEFLLHAALLGMEKIVENKAIEDLQQGDNDSYFEIYYHAREMAQQMLAETLGWA